MTTKEFLSLMQSRGAKFTAPATLPDITRTNTVLSVRNRAPIPDFFSDILLTTNGLNLGNGYIFGTSDFPQGTRTPAPSLVTVNEDTAIFYQLSGKTIFARNDLFWFAFDTSGTCYMLDCATLKTLRRYDDPLKSLTDCLIAGKL